MAIYKNTKISYFTLPFLFVAVNIFCSGTVSASQSDGEPEDLLANQRAHTDVSAAISSLSIADSALPTREEMQKGLARKTKVLIEELPKAKTALDKIEEILTAKARSFLSTNFLRATELAGLVSSAKMLNASAYNTTIFAARNGTSDDDLGKLGITVIGSSALKTQLIQFADFLASKDDTRDIDCSVLRDVSAKIHEITKDIDANLQDYPLGDD